MKIASSTMLLASMRRYAELETRRESLKAWTGNQRPLFDAPSHVGAPASRAVPDEGGAIPGGANVKSGPRPARPLSTPHPPPLPESGRGGGAGGEERLDGGPTAIGDYAGTVTIQGDPPQATALAKQVVDDLIPRWPSRGIGVNGSPHPSTSNIVQTLAKKASAEGMEDKGAGLTPELRIVKLLLEKFFGIKVKSISLPDAGPDAEHTPDQSERQARPWIDEGDAVYDRLRLWQGGSEGNGTPASLQQKGIGAIYLGREKTPFALKDVQNSLQGEIVASSVYLREDGSAGSIPRVNLVA